MGFLVGGASLKPEFVDIVNAASSGDLASGLSLSPSLSLCMHIMRKTFMILREKEKEREREVNKCIIDITTD